MSCVNCAYLRARIADLELAATLAGQIVELATTRAADLEESNRTLRQAGGGGGGPLSSPSDSTPSYASMAKTLPWNGTHLQSSDGVVKIRAANPVSSCPPRKGPGRPAAGSVPNQRLKLVKAAAK